ncbi:hypothetical protein GCM10011376_03480 [Nocardioides flavus (ex Wang et al. 2016)]|uniref:Uncharacterized protein n=1 Tax=Nocardioides flavus (ex Wang et al. 2016) TaxID=2058780 RepID=A0ABQ3HFU2_9ACTN|nr:hypothetical protein [Nocardioides flavus (ex Wang et al. 2016)]GHE15418.1 hypothetical protein GCM10011376_03480 [Nocardioides flavus (ex Wang et al. 2016)]
MSPTPLAASPSVRRAAATLLVTAAATQLLGQAWLRWSHARPAVDGSHPAAWVASHAVLLASAVALLGAVASLAAILGRHALTVLAVALFTVGQVLTVAVLVLDLGGGADDVRLVRALDAWDFLAVVGLVVLLLELRRRDPGLDVGASLALLALAVPLLDGLVVAATAFALAGFAVLAHDLVRPRPGPAPGWLVAVTAGAYVVAGAVSWQRAVLALVVVAWTGWTLRSGAPRPAASSRTPRGSRRSPARRP